MRKLLVANRGEIARRIIRSARALGLETVAIFSDVDAKAAHVLDADEGILVGSATARESYLRAGRIIEAAKETGADSLHPGYGFLSESAEFAEQVLQAGLTWIGAKPETLRAMGDKNRARKIAKQAGVPVVPGSDGVESHAEADLMRIASAVGYPLLVKASAGGGGIGMRRVESAETLVEAVTAIKSMATKYFSDGTVFLERYIPRARHVEIQVFGFGDGTAIHLFERDCSLQRRFQKVIEESPAPDLPDGVRDAMAQAAIALCQETRYSGAGTVEFIVDVATLKFFFLEMNTRIQVEHAVTEMITGVDLVAMQIDFAQGKLQRLDQKDIARTGHAVECRLYAERPEKRFLPSAGKLARFSFPPQSSTVRIEASYRTNDTVTPHYDPMLAKIITFGPDRLSAIEEARKVLNGSVIEGPSTNRVFLIACLESQKFQNADVHTHFIDDNYKQLLSCTMEI